MSATQQALLMCSGGSSVPGLLDAYSSGMVIAASTRKLLSTAVNSMQVRRMNDSATQDIGFAGSALDTSAITAFAGTNAVQVPIYYNQADASNNLVANGSECQIQESGGAFLDAPRSERSSRAMASTLDSSAATAFTLFLKINAANYGSGVNYVMMQGPGTNLFPQIKLVYGLESSNLDGMAVLDASNRIGKSNTSMSNGVTNVIAFKIVYGSPCAVTMYKDGSAMTTSQGNVSIGTANIAAMSVDNYVFGRDVGAGNGTTVKFFDIVLYESAVSNADMEAISALLA
jgi:hypothetical protein